VSWTVPLQITVSVGVTAAVGAAVPGGAPAGAGGADLGPALAGPPTIGGAVSEARSPIRAPSAVLAVRAGDQFRNGWIPPDPAVVVVLKDRGPATPQDLGLPSKVLGFPVEVRVAGPWDLAAAEGRLQALEGLPHTTYEKPADLELEEVN